MSNPEVNNSDFDQFDNTKSKRGWALITGASAGIGVELAKLMAGEGYNLVLTARRKELLNQLAGVLEKDHDVKVLTIASDLAQTGAPRQIYDELLSRKVDLDILVNNAGFGLKGFFFDLDVQQQVDMLQVNVVALTELTGLFLPAMLARRAAEKAERQSAGASSRQVSKDLSGVINLASVAAFQPGPLMAVYYASKAYVLSMSEALANEVADSGVTVTCVCPGPTATEFDKRAGLAEAQMFKALAIMDAKKVAKIGWDGFKDGKTVVITGLQNQLLAFSTRLAPTSITAKIARLLQE